MAKEQKAVDVKAAPASPVVAPEPIYGAAEIAQNSQRLFGYGIDLARAALDFNHIESCTLSKAKQIIKDFSERKVN